MKFIDGSLSLCNYLKTKSPGKPFDCVFEELGCRNITDMSIVNKTLQEMNEGGYLTLSDNKITYDAYTIQRYVDFYTISRSLEDEFDFLIQTLRDAYVITFFKKIKVTTALARPVTISSIYNFASAVTIAINKVLKQPNGKYNIDCITAQLGKLISQYKMMDASKTLKSIKEGFSAYKAEVKSDIQGFNDFRNKLFAHSDPNSQLKVEQVDEEKAIIIVKRCLQYCVECKNLIDDDKIEPMELGKIFKTLRQEAGYFVGQLMGK